MWLVFGITAIITAVINNVRFCKGKNSEVFCYVSLSFTALTACAFYSTVAEWTGLDDWGALEDVVPTMSKALWILVLASIVINGWPVLKRRNKGL